MTRLTRFLILLTAAVLLLPGGIALAEDKPLAVSFSGPVTLSPGQQTQAVTVANASGDVVYSITDMQKRTVVYTQQRAGVQAGQSLTWPVPADIAGLDAAHPVKQMRLSFVLNGKACALDLYFSLENGKGPGIVIERGAWYHNNTACAFGLAFRDVKPGLTDKWYTFAPVDLTVQGRQEFEYIASSLYVIGTVYVDVNGDSVTVTYRNFYDGKGGRTETKEEFFTFFPDLGAVSQVEPEMLQGQARAFGVPLSIENDLNGDTRVLLFVRNRVTYCNYVTPTRQLTRYWPNLPERKALREEMLRLMDP